MDLHPIFVHFPIALLTLYAVLEVARFQKLNSLPYWFYVKGVLVISGFLGSIAALITGDMAAELNGTEVTGVLKMHQNFAIATTIIFGVIASIYLIMWISKSEWNTKLMSGRLAKLWALKLRVASWIFNNTFLMVLLAIVGFVSITITGALGGIMVYGPDIDPVAKLVYNLFVK